MSIWGNINMGIKEDNKIRDEKFLEILDENPEGIHTDELRKLLGKKDKPLGIRTLEGIRKKYIDKGYVIENLKRGSGIWRRNKAKENGYYHNESEADSDQVEAAFYLYILKTSSKKFTKKSFLKKINSFDVAKDNRKKSELSQSDKFNRIIDIMQNEGFITLVKSDDGEEYIEIPKESSIYLPVMSMFSGEPYEEDAFNLLNYFKNYSGKLDDILIPIKEKLQFLIDGEITENIHELRGRKINFSSINEEIYSCFKNINYRENAIHIKYKNQKEKISDYNFKIGLIYYSKNQDTVYILGEKTESGKIFNLKLSCVETAEELEDKNDIYMSKKYENIFDKMFGASYEKEEFEVVVKFDRIESVEEKIKQLNETRRFSSVDIIIDERSQKEKIVYKDKIIGLSEFAAYMRQFGKACEVIEPLTLRNEMAKSPERVLRRYKEEGVI